MVAATQPNSQPENQQPRQQLQRKQSIIQPTSSSAQEEALKRNTDCVYFLASPLTCKKGTDCEYRHSEYARVNPRDCWFWLNGNCLNPKCGYRHPPLDGLLGAENAPVTGPAVPSSQDIATPAIHMQYGPKSVPCVFFLQGQCLKGDKCLFLHGPNTSIAAPQVWGTKLSEAPRHTKTFGSLEKCNQEKRVPQANIAKSAPNGSGSKPGVGTAAETNKTFVNRVVTPPVKVTSIPAAVNGISARRINRLHPSHVSDHQNLQNGKDSEEFLRESSPGFDVLVDDDLRASDDYYHNEDRYERGEESLNPVTEYDRSAEYNSLVDVHNHGRFQDLQTYASYDQMPGPYPQDQHMTSPERLLVGQAHVERRGYKKSGSPENVVSDLRHRLSKQRRVNGLRSVVSQDTSLDHIEERNFRSSSRKDPVRQPLNERSVSNRLRGRIKLPERSSVNGVEDSLRGRNRSLSLERPHISSHPGRLGERMSGRLQNYYDQEKNFRVQQMRRDINDAGSSDFAGPKSLAELKKSVKHTENKEQPVLKKRKTFEEDHQCIDFSFDGPKPLSEILKEKQQAASSPATSLNFGSSNVKEKIDESNNIKISGSDNKDVTGTQSGFTTMVKEDGNINVTENVVDRNNLVHSQSSEGPTAKENEVGDGMTYDEKLEDQELEGDDQRGEFYEDQAYEEDYAYDGDQNVDQEEYLDEEDGDDFAKKIGVMLT